MIRNLILAISTFLFILILSVPVLAESTSSDDKYDDRKDIGQKLQPTSPPGSGMQNNPAAPNLNNPAMVNPSDPTGVNSNTPGSSGIPPSSSVPGMNSGNSSGARTPSGH
jgi:hypothetical protein